MAVVTTVVVVEWKGVAHTKVSRVGAAPRSVARAVGGCLYVFVVSQQPAKKRQKGRNKGPPRGGQQASGRQAQEEAMQCIEV